MRILQQSEVASVAGGLMAEPTMDPNFSGRYGCPDGYSGVTLYTTTVTQSYPSGSTTSGMGTGSTTVTMPAPKVETSTRYECLPPVNSGSTSGSGSTGSGSTGSGSTSSSGDSSSSASDQSEDDEGVCMVP